MFILQRATKNETKTEPYCSGFDRIFCMKFVEVEQISLILFSLKKIKPASHTVTELLTKMFIYSTPTFYAYIT